jgi:hypothetical protein
METSESFVTTNDRLYCVVVVVNDERKKGVNRLEFQAIPFVVENNHHPMSTQQVGWHRIVLLGATILIPFFSTKEPIVSTISSLEVFRRMTTASR